MGKAYPSEIIPEIGSTLPPGRFLFAIEQMSDARPSTNNFYQIETTLRVHEPASYAHEVHFERFVIGTETDPEANDPDTWKKFPAQRYRNLMESTGVGMSGDIEQDIAQATGQLVGAIVEHRMMPATPQYPTPRVNSQVSKFFKPGEKETGIDEGKALSADGQQAVTNARPAPAVRPGARPAAAAPAAARPTPAAAPAAQSAPATATVPKAQMIRCSICNQQVPRVELTAHVQAHDSDQE